MNYQRNIPHHFKLAGTRIWKAICRAIKQRYCQHVVYYMETMHRRPDGMVEGTCDRCKKVFVVEYGLLLPGLDQRKK